MFKISNLRYIKSIKTSIAAFISRLTNIICGAVVAPVIISYSNVEMFGYWLTITSMIGIFVIVDIGIGSALVNIISSNNSSRNLIKLNKIISTAFLALIFIGITLLILLIIIFNHVEISNLIKLSSDLNQAELHSILLITIFIFCINIPLSIISQIQLGFQNAYINEYFRTSGYIGGTAFLLIAINYNLPLYIILMGYSGIPVIANLLNIIYYFSSNKKDLHLKLEYYSWQRLRELLNSGLIFFFITIANILGTNLDNFLIAAYIGTTDVSIFAITKQMFSILYFIVLISSPFWPVFSEAIQKKNVIEIKKLLLNLNVFTLIPTILICLFLVIWGKNIIHIWINEDLNPSTQLLISFAFFWIISCLAQPIIYLMQVDKYKNILLALTCLFALSSLLIKYFFISKFGIVGVMWTNTFTYLIFFIIPAYYLCFNNLNSKKFN